LGRKSSRNRLVGAALATFDAYELARQNTASSLDVDRSTATLTLFLVSFWVLALVAWTYTPWRIGLLAAVPACFAAVALLPGARELTALTFPSPRDTLTRVSFAVLSAILILLFPRDPAPPTQPAGPIHAGLV
jgi:cation-transporting ATPase E